MAINIVIVELILYYIVLYSVRKFYYGGRYHSGVIIGSLVGGFQSIHCSLYTILYAFMTNERILNLEF